MAKPVTLTLKEPITGHKGPVTTITVKPPGLILYQQHGEPYDFVRAGARKSAPVYVEHDDAIAAYIAACVVPPEDNPLLLDQIGLADAMAIKATVLGFFDAARRALQ